MEYGLDLVMFKERGIWWLSRIVVDRSTPTGLKDNLITEEEMSTVQCTGQLVQPGTTFHAQAKCIMYAQRNNSLCTLELYISLPLNFFLNVMCYFSYFFTYLIRIESSFIN